MCKAYNRKGSFDRTNAPYFESSLFSRYSGRANDSPTTRFDSRTTHHPAIFWSRASRRDQTKKITEATIKSAAKKLEIRVAKISSTNSPRFGPWIRKKGSANQ